MRLGDTSFWVEWLIGSPVAIAVVEDAATQSRLPIGDLAQQKFNTLPKIRQNVVILGADPRTAGPDGPFRGEEARKL